MFSEVASTQIYVVTGEVGASSGKNGWLNVLFLGLWGQTERSPGRALFHIWNIYFGNSETLWGALVD